jgi:hypothetical protein
MNSSVAPKENTATTVEIWTIEQWLASRAEWTRLVGQSRCDPLFLSWEWQTSWWRVFGGGAGSRLVVLAARDARGELLGAAPLYESAVSRRGLRLRSLQFIGSAFRDDSVVQSEHLDFLAAEARYPELASELLDAATSVASWEEFVAMCVRADSRLPALLRSQCRGFAFQRAVDDDRSYRIDLAPGFDAYLATLTAAARRRLWNMRSRLERRGAVALRRLEPGELPRALATLNALHQRRWGRQLFVGRTLEFHCMLGAAMAERGALALSELTVGEQVVSVFYDYRLGARQYNLQMGYDENIDRSASLGLLHLGYVLEKCAADGVRDYELLCGRGRATDYKRRFASDSVATSTVQWWRGKAALVGRGFELVAKARRLAGRT